MHHAAQRVRVAGIRRTTSRACLTRTRRACLAIGAASLFASGCFRYVPVELAAVPDGNDVRMYLTRQGLAALDELPLESGPIVRGKLITQDNGDVTLRVPVATRQTGFHSSMIGQDVRIPTGDIVQVERRQLDKLGTGLLIGGAIGVTALVMTLILDSHSETVVEPPPPEEIRVPLFTLRIR